MARGSPDKVDEQTISGLPVRFEYWTRRRDAVVIPDESALAKADCYEVLRLWIVIGRWAVRFCEVNRGWKVNGSSPVEVLEES